MNDFVTIAPVATTPLVFYARNSMPAKDLTELIAWLKVNPSKASMGVIDSSIHVLSALFQKETGTQFDLVPYGGVAPAMQDLVAGQIDVLIASPDQLPLMRAGSIKAYAVTSGMRLMMAPDIPTFAEMGLPALSFTSWYGPRDSIGKINAAAVDALADQAVQSRLVDLGYEVFPRERQTPEALGALVRADAAKWWPIIKELGIKAR
jgi:tripartite-type tricarboxylate transporter receptor subunit TctC